LLLRKVGKLENVGPPHRPPATLGRANKSWLCGTPRWQRRAYRAKWLRRASSASRASSTTSDYVRALAPAPTPSWPAFLQTRYHYQRSSRLWRTSSTTSRPTRRRRTWTTSRWTRRLTRRRTRRPHRRPHRRPRRRPRHRRPRRRPRRRSPHRNPRYRSPRLRPRRRLSHLPRRRSARRRTSALWSLRSYNKQYSIAHRSPPVWLMSSTSK
jgi:hypothetical protein